MRHSSNGVGAVILAAGSSSRMGRPKQILRFGAESLLRRATRAAVDAGCSPVVVVTGANAEQSRGELERLPVEEVLNTRWETGMASSIRCGIERLLSVDADTEAAVLMLCDQPHVTADVVSTLVAAHRETGKCVVASTYRGILGVPALFSRAVFSELIGLEGMSGAKQVIERHACDAEFLSFKGGEVDVDTPEDYLRLVTGQEIRTSR